MEGYDSHDSTVHSNSTLSLLHVSRPYPLNQ